MNGHVDTWLAAYHDGELSGHRLRVVERHLAECESCQLELESLASLSVLLAEAPEPTFRSSPDRFAAQVQLRLPYREPATVRRQTGLLPGWTLAPLTLFAAWAMCQATLIVSSVVVGVLDLPPVTVALGQLAATLPGWAHDLIEGGWQAFRLMGGTPLEGMLLLPGVWSTLLFGVLSGVWLALWLMRQRTDVMVPEERTGTW